MPMLTSTESVFPRLKRRGCILRSGSLRKQLGLAWCWLCRWFHQLAGNPCTKTWRPGIQTWTVSTTTIYPPLIHSCTTLPLQAILCECKDTPFHCLIHINSREYSHHEATTFRTFITTICRSRFHLGFLKTEQCPRSCWKKAIWIWKTKQSLGKKIHSGIAFICLGSLCNFGVWVHLPPGLGKKPHLLS